MPKSEDREEFSLTHRPSTITHTTAIFSTNPNAFLSSTTRNAMMNGIIFSGPLAAVIMGCFLASQNLGRKLTNTEMLAAFIVLLLCHTAPSEHFAIVAMITLHKTEHSQDFHKYNCYPQHFSI